MGHMTETMPFLMVFVVSRMVLAMIDLY